MRCSFLFLSTLFIYCYVWFMEELKKNLSEEIKKRIFVLPCWCFDLLATARSVQAGNEWPGSKSLESASIGGRIGLILFSLFVRSSCGKWEKEVPFTKYRSLSYAVFTLVPQGMWWPSSLYRDCNDCQEARAEEPGFSARSKPHACALRILCFSKRSLQSIFVWRLLSYIFILKKILFKAFYYGKF